MTTTITATGDKHLIALNYLGMAAKDYRSATTSENRLNALRVIRIYMSLALNYGCTVNEIRMALGWPEGRVRFLIDDMRGE